MTAAERAALKAAIDAKRREAVTTDCNNASITLYWNGCRCKACRKAESEYRRQLRLAGTARVMTHSKNGYTRGCRCETCSTAHKAYQARYRLRKKQAT